MLIYTKIADLQAFLNQKRSEEQSIGFVPTMGALHPGHISLIASCRQHCQIAVCSIFVNPTQFNDKADLERYPRTPKNDIALLEAAGCDVLFMPEVVEMYPSAPTETYDFGQLDKVLEGRFRPGHFNGVAQVVKRLFEIVKPHKAFFGSKDYQQVMVVKALVVQMRSAIEIVPCPILREADGLAMSSRNVLLTAHERQVAGSIPRLMQAARDILHRQGPGAAKRFVAEEVQQNPLMRLDYYEVCHAETLQLLNDGDPLQNSVALIAVFVGKVRLIDNLI